MESGRFILAIILVIAVIVITNVLFQPPPAPPPADTPAATRTDTAAPRQPAAEPEPAAPLPEVIAPPTAVGEPVAADTIVVASPLYRYALSTRGAAVVGAELLEYESFTREGPVELAGPESPSLLAFGLRIDGRALDLRTLAFEAETAADTVRLAPGDAPVPVTFVHRDPDGRFAIRVTYTFSPESYAVGVAGEVGGLPASITPQLTLELPPTLAVNEADSAQDHRALAFVTRGSREGIVSVALDDVDEPRTVEGPLQWVGIKNKYFLVVAVRDEAEEAREFGGLIAEPLGIRYAADLMATLPLDANRNFAFRLYMGPQQYDRLAALNYDLEDVNPYGWRLFRPIIQPLAHLVLWAVTGLHEVLNLAYGWVLIIFGVLIRLVLWPLNARAGRAQMKNMALQPRIQEIQKKYKQDPERLQKEMLRLYREEGFNPLGGCLPMLIPFPVLITLFFVFQNTIEFRGVEFLWLPDLSLPDPYYLLPIILGASIFGMQRVTMSVAPQNPQMKMMVYFMPAFMVLIFLNLASGLNLYYAAQNVASIPQQLQLARERKAHQEKLRR